MIGRELPREFFAEGRIPGEFLKFADVNGSSPLSIFPSLDSTGGFPLCFEEQCTQNVLGMMGCGPGGQHLFKRGPYQRILFELPFDGRMRSQVGQRIHRFASYRDLIRLAFAEVCELKGIMNVLQVHVFLHRLREELALMRELGHPTRFDSLVDDLFMLANQAAKFRKFGIVHFRYPSRGPMLLRRSLVRREEGGGPVAYRNSLLRLSDYTSTDAFARGGPASFVDLFIARPANASRQGGGRFQARQMATRVRRI